MTTSICVVCGRSCVPMADYDQPTCVDCDQAMELVMVRATLTAAQADPERPRPRLRPRDIEPEPWRTVASCYGPAAPDVIERLIDDLNRPVERAA